MVANRPQRQQRGSSVVVCALLLGLVLGACGGADTGPVRQDYDKVIKPDHCSNVSGAACGSSISLPPTPTPAS
jgi:hypothetical protein